MDARRDRTSMIAARAGAIAECGGLGAAVDRGTLDAIVDVTLSEGLVLGLLKQGVSKYLSVFGHGSTDLGEVLRIYEQAGVTRTYNFRNEVAMAHAATSLRWQFGETPAVVTSIGPGALLAMSGSLASASNGVGVYHIYGDETTHGEGFNMQQIPKREQDLYGRITAIMGESYVLHTPFALRDALRRGATRVFHPYRAGPFYLLLPINTQPERIAALNLQALPERPNAGPIGVPGTAALAEAARIVLKHRRVVIKAGGGCRGYPAEIRALADAVDGVVALSPGALGVLPDQHPRNMHVGGSKGTISGNFAMSEADLAIIVGSRAVCQADCSGVGYEHAEAVINLNGDLADATHYNKTVALVGDIGVVARQLTEAIQRAGGVPPGSARTWLAACADKKSEWRRFRDERFQSPPLMDDVWGRPVLTQPAAIKVAIDFASAIGAAKYFDAGDVQAHGFQIAEDDDPGETFTETGASFMGFAASALIACGIADERRYGIAFCGDGSFMMNPQALIDGVQHRVHGTVVIFDNRRMASISGLQVAQYGKDFRTSDSVAVDYAALAATVRGVKALSGGFSRESLRAALDQAHRHPGLSLVHVPVYYGADPQGGLGVYGLWNVGNWCEDVQARYHRQDL